MAAARLGLPTRIDARTNDRAQARMPPSHMTLHFVELRSATE